MNETENLQILRTEFEDFLTSIRSFVMRALTWAAPVLLFAIAFAMLVFLMIYPALAAQAFHVLSVATAGVPVAFLYVLPVLFVLAGAWFFIKDMLKIRDRMVTTFSSKAMGAFLQKLVTYDFRVLHALRDSQENRCFHYLKSLRRVEGALSVCWFFLGFLSEKLLLENAFYTDTIFHLQVAISATVLCMLMLYAVNIFFEALFYLPRLIRVFIAMAVAMKESNTRLSQLFQEQKTD